MAKATSSRESGSKTEVPVYSDTLGADSQNGNTEKRAHRANAARHARKCTVCHHKDREFIDQDYLRWLSPKKIAREYAISHHSVVYRHADATGLRAQRRASLRATLENFIEQAESVRATAGSVVAAVRLYAQINDQGQWVPPVRRHIVEHHYIDERSQDQPSIGPNQPAAPTACPRPASQKTDGVSPVATIAAGSAQCPDPSHTKDHPENSRERSSKGTASPDKFPAVPVASINFAPDLPISNREHVELEHAATH
jgi:hypothetical protein